MGPTNGACPEGWDEVHTSQARSCGRRHHRGGELARLEGAGRDAFLTVLDEAAPDEQVGIWRAMIGVLDSGEHCPHHFRGRKPQRNPRVRALLYSCSEILR